MPSLIWSLLFVYLLACGKDKLRAASDQKIEPAPPQVASVSLDPPTAVIKAGGIQTLTAVVLNAQEPLQFQWKLTNGSGQPPTGALEDSSGNVGTSLRNTDVAIRYGASSTPQSTDVSETVSVSVEDANHTALGTAQSGITIKSSSQTPCVFAVTSLWQFHDTPQPVCTTNSKIGHGNPKQFDDAKIPDETDPDWSDVDANPLNFSRHSRATNCSEYADFDYWQTFLVVPPGQRMSSVVFTIDGADDGARITIFNSKYPAGIVDPGSYVAIFGPPTTSDLAHYIKPGKNRIVLTHLDEQPSHSGLVNAKITINGIDVVACH